MITSLQNRRIKSALKLRRRRGRDQQQRFLIDGAREIQQALDARMGLIEAFVCRPLLEKTSPGLWSQLQSADCEVLEVNAAVWEKLNYGNRQDGAIVVAQYVPCTLAALQPQGDGPIVVVDRVEKPGNFGAILRTATAASASAVIASDPQTDLLNPNAIRASLGTIFRIPIAAATAEEAFDWLQQAELPIYVARVDASQSPYDTALGKRCAIVLGSESDGVSDTWRDERLEGVVLPMQGPIDSLNVANTAAILLYEALRQRESGN